MRRVIVCCVLASTRPSPFLIWFVTLGDILFYRVISCRTLSRYTQRVFRTIRPQHILLRFANRAHDMLRTSELAATTKPHFLRLEYENRERHFGCRTC